MNKRNLKLNKSSIAKLEGFKTVITPVEQMNILGGGDTEEGEPSDSVGSTTTPGTKGCNTQVNTCWCNCSDNA